MSFFNSMNKFFRYLPVFLLFPFGTALAQTGLSVSPPRTYVTSAAGQSSVNKILVTNTSKDVSLNLTVSLSDWQYDEQGNNVVADAGTLANSATPWITIKPQSYFTLAPGETHELEVTVMAPAQKDSVDVHTSLLFITQTNPVDSFEQGALVKVSLRSGVKIYHRYNSSANASIEFNNYLLDKKSGSLQLALENTGNIWTDGTVITELVNVNDGTKYELEDQIIYTLPGDKRNVRVPLPAGLKPGKYTASSTLSYGDDDTIKMAELAFVYE